jgi:hypothetical protein
MTVTTSLVYDIRHIIDTNPMASGLRITFRDGTAAVLYAAHANFETLRRRAEAGQKQAVPVGVILDSDSRIVDLNTAHDSSIQVVEGLPEDANRLKVACWGYSSVCYLTRDHPDFERIYSTRTQTVGTRRMLWIANHSDMVEDEPEKADGEFEMWWKVMDVRPQQKARQDEENSDLRDDVAVCPGHSQDAATD